MTRRGAASERHMVASGAERLAAVAAASRAGASAREAWQEWDECGVTVTDGLPDLTSGDALARDALAAARLAHRAGIPLAEVVTALARIEGVRDAALLSREVALAGPRASARLLGWLPAVGLALGVIVEPRTAGVLLTTLLGWTLCLLAAALTAGGRRWMRALARSALEAGSVP